MKYHTKENTHDSTGRVALAVSLLLYGVYWLTVSGAFHSIDEHAVFAVARDLVYHGQIDQSSLFWGEPYLQQAQIGRDGALYSKYGIGHSLLLAVPLLLARLIPGAMLGSSSALLAMVATAATAGMLVASTRRLGYSIRVGVSVALLFGLSTFSWVYADTTFSDPLVAFLWVVALWALLGEGGQRRGWMAGLALAVGVAVRPASALAVPFFALGLWLSVGRARWRTLAAFALPLVVVVVLLLAFNLWRFGEPFDFGYSERFDGSLVAGLTGFLFSLDRSIFLFAPPLLLLVPAVLRFPRHQRLWGGVILAIALFVLLSYSLWPVFWGGPVWGPRYLLPAVPLLLLMIAPVVESAWNHVGWERVSTLGVALAGMVFQLPGVLWNSLPQTQTLGQRYPLWLLRPQPEWLDLVWLVRPEGAVLSLAMIGIALVALRRVRWWRVAVLGGVLATLLLLSWLGQVGLGFQWRPVDQAVLDRVQAVQRPGDALVLNPAPFQEPLALLFGYLNRPDVEVASYGVYRLSPEEMPAQEDQWSHLVQQHERFWVLTDGVPPGDPASTGEQALLAHTAAGASEWLSNDTRLTLYERSRPPTENGPADLRFGDAARLVEWAISPGATAQGVQLTLVWEPLAVPTHPIHTVAQLLDTSGELIAGWDNVPRAGFMPAKQWQPGAAFEESMVLEVPQGLSAGALTVVVGLVDPVTGARLMTPDGRELVELTEIAYSEP